MRAPEVPNVEQTGGKPHSNLAWSPLRAAQSNMRDIIHEIFVYLLLSRLFTLGDRVVENLIYIRVSHLLWLNVVKGTFGLYCTAWARKRGEEQSKTRQEAETI